MTLSKNYFYDKQGLWLLYLMCALPLFFWELLLSFRDVSWMAERTNMGDAIANVFYGMLFIFVESVLYFIVIAALGFLVLRVWGTDRRIALMSALALITALWSIIEQLYFLMGASISPSIVRALAFTGRPVLTMYIVALALVSVSVILPTYALLRSEKALKIAQDIFERLSTLSMFYLFLNFIGWIVIFIRNIN